VFGRLFCIVDGELDAEVALAEVDGVFAIRLHRPSGFLLRGVFDVTEPARTPVGQRVEADVFDLAVRGKQLPHFIGFCTPWDVRDKEPR